MDFKKYEDEVNKWLITGSEYNLVDAWEAERRLIFQSKNGSIPSHSFFVVCPENESKPWHVWSDDDFVLERMQEIQDFVGGCRKKSLTELLNFIQNHLNKSLAEACGGSSNDVDDEGMDDCDDDDDFYYHEEDIDAEIEDAPKGSDDSDDETDQLFFGNAQPAAVQRLLTDLKSFKKSSGKFGIQGQPRHNNICIWDIKLTDFPKESLLGKNLQEFARKYGREPVVYMEMKFPPDYPMSPPFVRVIRPRFKFLSGHVTIGGSVCMELLTQSGWRPTNDIESILVQIRAEIMSDEKASLELKSDRPYDEVEAKQAFERMVTRYGWNKH